MSHDHLSRIQSPADLKRLRPEALPEVADELRDRIVQVVSKTGGHSAPSLGVVELTIALQMNIPMWNCSQVRHYSCGDSPPIFVASPNGHGLSR